MTRRLKKSSTDASPFSTSLDRIHHEFPVLSGAFRLLEWFMVFLLTRGEATYNSTYSQHHRPHKTAMRSPHNYTLYNGTTPNIMGLIWPYNSPSLPIPALLQEGLKAPMSWDLSPGTISKYTQCTVTMYTHWEENGSKFSLTRGPGYRQVGHSHLSTEQPYNTSWLPTSLTN